MIKAMITKYSDYGLDLRLWVELRGFEPLAPSMRTSAGPVDPGRMGTPVSRSSPFRPLLGDSVAVLVCCTQLPGTGLFDIALESSMRL
jgi:hypothetical protein